MSFDDIRLPLEIEQGAVVSPEFLVTKITLSNGYSRRNLRNSMPIRKWDISYGLQGLTGADATQGILAIYDFYNARGGTFSTFRMRDWIDYQLIAAVIGTGNGAEYQYQIIKTYTDFGSFIRTEDITKPSNHVDDPAAVLLVNAVSQTEGVDYDINYSTGMVTFLAAGANIALTDASMVVVDSDNRQLTFDAGDVITGVTVGDYMKISGFTDPDNLIDETQAWKVTVKVAGQIDFTLTSGRNTLLGVAEGPVASGVTLNRMTPIPSSQDIVLTINFDRHVGFDNEVDFELGWAQVGRVKKIKVKEERG